MTSITVLAGERTIGGTQILVEDGGARLLFDCGLAYDPAGDPFNQVLRRPGRLLGDLLSLGLAPYVPRLYAPPLLGGFSPPLASTLPDEDGPLAVALSHAHLDHTALVGFVDPAVPVYCTQATARIVECLGDLGSALTPQSRSFGGIEAPGSFTVGSMHIELLPVDHDICGAGALLIHTSGGTIAYSGDLRLHGSSPDLSLSFARAARAAEAGLLILEGTRLWPRDPAGAHTGDLEERRESDLAPMVAETLLAAPRELGVILLTAENGERVESLATTMAAIGRLLVLDAAGLALATAALGRPLNAPHAVYIPSTEDAVPRQSLDYAANTRLRSAIGTAHARISGTDLAADPGHFLLRLDWPRFADLLDFVPAAGGAILFHANGLPLGPFDPAWHQLEWWAQRLGLRLVPVGSSGHASPADLTAIAEEAGASVVMCVHSQHPQLLQTGAARLVLPERGRRYDLADCVSGAGRLP